MRYILLIFLFWNSTTNLIAQINLLKEASDKAHQLIKNQDKLTENDIIEGLTEALIQSTKKSVRLAGSEGGFIDNSLIYISFPPSAEKMRSSLIKTGMSKQVIDFEKCMNQAAEKASKEGLPIFLKAIKSMSIQDASDILEGDDVAATNYLRNETFIDLYNQFKPITRSMMKEIMVTKYWKQLINRYNTLPFTEPIETDLEDYVTNKTIDGLFVLIAEEERNIRRNPEARYSVILKRVFK